jgi:acetylornithine/N-succinyldiaminopimelate aminotransferase
MSASPLYPSYARYPVEFERGEGSWLFTAAGERYLDFTSGIAVNTLGHAHPGLVEALTRQAHKLWHVSNLFEVAGQRELAERLVANSFADRVFFANSGAEALECAIKTARRYHHHHGRPERYRIITFEGAFHGRTLATLAAGGQKKYLEGFGPVVEGFDQVPFNDIAAAKGAIGPETAAILVEPIQGEGGVREPDAAFLRELRHLCDEHGLLLVLDEVQTGIGRTGQLFAYQWSGIEPDILATAKGIGGGFPLGACLATEDAASGMTPGSHNSTFGGNPLAMAVAIAVIDTLTEPGFLEEVRRKGLLLKQGLASVVDSHPDVYEEVRGRGLLLGLKCRVPVAEVNDALRALHMLAVPAGENVLRLLPPLNVTEDEIALAVRHLGEAAGAMSGRAEAAES